MPWQINNTAAAPAAIAFQHDCCWRLSRTPVAGPLRYAIGNGVTINADLIQHAAEITAAIALKILITSTIHLRSGLENMSPLDAIGWLVTRSRPLIGLDAALTPCVSNPIKIPTPKAIPRVTSGRCSTSLAIRPNASLPILPPNLRVWLPMRTPRRRLRARRCESDRRFHLRPRQLRHRFDRQRGRSALRAKSLFRQSSTVERITPWRT